MTRIAPSVGLRLCKRWYSHTPPPPKPARLPGHETQAWQRRAERIRAGHETSTLALLEERGFVNQIAGDRNELDRLLTTRRIGAYTGIDPTASSLHLGHLVPLMILFWLRSHGHQTISLVGGATARIGDPTGRLTSRQQLASSVFQNNIECIDGQLKRLWQNAEKCLLRHGSWISDDLGEREGLGHRGHILNNATWMNKLSVVDFLRFMGAGARLGTMLGRDTVRNKMAEGDGMSFAELSYPLLQAWDWWHMYNTYAVQLQVGGSDQYGNIIAGMDAIKYMIEHHPTLNHSRYKMGEQLTAPVGLTVPLLTTAAGAKFGKSAGNAIWLDKEQTSSFDLYGFFLKTADADVERYLKLFTFLPAQEVADIVSRHTDDPTKRLAQHQLAFELVCLVHGEREAATIAEEHRRMRRPSLQTLATRLDSTSDHGPQLEVEGKQTSRVQDAQSASMPEGLSRLPRSLVYGTTLSHILHSAGLVKSRGEAARAIGSGGVYVGRAGPGEEIVFEKARDDSAALGETLLVNGDLLVLRMGKWKVKVIKVYEADGDDGQ